MGHESRSLRHSGEARDDEIGKKSLELQYYCTQHDEKLRDTHILNVGINRE